MSAIMIKINYNIVYLFLYINQINIIKTSSLHHVFGIVHHVLLNLGYLQ